MTETPQSLLKLVNKSGFLFQNRLSHEITNTRTEHHWKVIAEEHRWTDLETHREAFIDIVLNSRSEGKMVIECKRVSEGDWVFLVPANDGQDTSFARILWSQPDCGRDWDDFTVYPKSPKSMFCIVRGQGEGNNPMLERLAGLLTRSVEGLAAEETSFDPYSNKPEVYYPVIVTNATLHVCRYDTSNIDLVNGTLELPQANFETVPMIRFQKGLSTSISSPKSMLDLTKSALQNERTVFVINVSSIIQMLKDWQLNRLSSQLPLPWERDASSER